MSHNLIGKLTMNEYAAKAVCTVAKSTVTILTNPVAATAITVTTLGYLSYKHYENKDKRKYEYAR